MIDLNDENFLIFAIKNYNNPGCEGLSDLEEDLKRFKESIEDFNKAIEIDPEYAQYYITRGDYFNKLKNYEKAIINYKKAIELNSEEVNYYYSLTTSYEDQKDYQNALLIYDKLAEISPEESSIYYYRGLLFQNHLKNNESAEKDYFQALELNANYSDVYIQLGVIYQLKEDKKALEYFKKAIEIDPETRNNYFPLINYYILLNDFDSAINLTKKTIESDPKDADGYYKLSLIYLKQKDYLNSFLELTRAIEKKMSFEEYFILDFDGITRIELSNMYYNRAELSKLLNSQKLMCEDYNRVILEISNEESDKKEEIETLILENCN